ncbi:MAG: Ig-like domain-containing protein [Actinobacteria bacterium]|nr:Ig-like domain-containing protein [Actinomycetota bacterium]
MGRGPLAWAPPLALLGLLGLLALGGRQASADGPTTFSNATPINVTDRACPAGSPPGTATLYPSTINVSGMSGTVTTLTVSVKGATHAFPGDFEALLVGPTGQNIKLFSDAGGQPTTNVTVNFSDAAAGVLPQNAAWGAANSTVSSKPIDYNEPGFPDVFPAPAPTPSAATTLAGAFNGTNPNGTWSLYVIDDACGDAGSFGGGWSLTVTTASLVASTTTLAASPNPTLTGTPVTFTATVTSNGNPVTSGTVTFREGATVLAANVPVNGSGVATFTTSSLSEGPHVITADFNGNATAGTSSASVTEVLDNPTTVTGNTYCNTGVITGNNPGPATPYPSKIFVSGVSGTTSKVVVTLKNVNHPYPADLDVLLVAPTGQNLVLVSDAGNSPPANVNTNVTANFDDAAAGFLPQQGPWGSPNSTVTVKPTNYLEPGLPDSYPAPAPAPSAATTLSTFNGQSPNGTWSLFVNDDSLGDTGNISGGWCLTITSVAATPTTTTLASSPNPSLTGQPATFTATVTSGGSPVTTGTVTFKEGATVLASGVALNGSGVATFTTSALAQGDHVITAEYSGTVTLGPSAGSVDQRVDNATVVTGTSYCNTGAITGGTAAGPSPATPYPSNVFVTGFPATTAKVTVDLKGVTHAFPGDFDILLVSPTGQSLILASDAGDAATPPRRRPPPSPPSTASCPRARGASTWSTTRSATTAPSPTAGASTSRR